MSAPSLMQVSLLAKSMSLKKPSSTASSSPRQSKMQSMLRMKRQSLKHVSPIARKFASPSKSLVQKVAAMNIQRAFRGFRARKDFGYKKAAAQDIQRVFRGRKVRRQVRNAKVFADFFRGMKNDAARTIQSAYRAHRKAKNNRAWFSPIKNIAATHIQRVYRGHMARKRLPHRSPTKYTSPNVSPVKSLKRMPPRGLRGTYSSTRKSRKSPSRNRIHGESLKRARTPGGLVFDRPRKISIPSWWRKSL
jgi:hypothetical protein